MLAVNGLGLTHHLEPDIDKFEILLENHAFNWSYHFEPNVQDFPRVTRGRSSVYLVGLDVPLHRFKIDFHIPDQDLRISKKAEKAANPVGGLDQWIECYVLILSSNTKFYQPRKGCLALRKPGWLIA